MPTKFRFSGQEMISLQRSLFTKKGMRLPNSFSKKRTAGIVCVELFDPAYSHMLCEPGLPVLFIDSYAICPDRPPEADCLYMDNQTGIYQFVQEMVRRGKKKIGFIGEYMHCQSFYERYAAYRNAACFHGIPCPEESCILKNKEDMTSASCKDYQEYPETCIQKIPSLPVITPSLTAIHSQIMGYSAGQLLVSRIREPSLKFRAMHTETNLIYRESTEG